MAEEPQKRFETFTDDFGNEWYDREQVDTEIERLIAALRDLRYRSPLTALDVERICEQALRRSWDYPRSSPVETAGSPSTHEAVESAISQSKNRDAKWGESVHPRTPVLNGEIVPDQPTTPPGREHRWHFVDGQYKCWDCPATFEFWQNGPPMRVAGPEASGEATGPEGDDSNMGTAPTSGPEATSSQGNAEETAGEPSEIWACVSKGISPPYVRFFESKAEMEAYEWRDDSVSPNRYRPAEKANEGQS